MSTLLLLAACIASAELPVGSAPTSLAFDHFPSRAHAFVWRNWSLVPIERMAAALDAAPGEVESLAESMGLAEQPAITEDQRRRSYITVIRRNWHLVPYDQLMTLLDWDADELAFVLREDDFLYVKLGLLKPKCDPLRIEPLDEPGRAKADAIKEIVEREFDGVRDADADPLFAFVKRLSEPPTDSVPHPESRFSPRYCYSYFALYGDPLLEPETDPYPDGYLDRVAAAGADGVWLQGVLYKLAPFPWDESLSERYEERLENLKALVARAKTHGIGIYLYMNEPRAMPLAFYEKHPDLRGVVEGDHAALCTSAPEVQAYIRESVSRISAAVPDLAGFFTITGSENLTNCWSHGNGAGCPRCGMRPASDVVAEVNRLIAEGIAKAGAPTRLIAWDWGWNDAWAVDAINALPDAASLMSVSEWSIPIERGGVKTAVGEYSISTIGPGPRATKHWAAARARGLKTIAKIQAGNTWELAAVPYIPAVQNVAQHAANLREANIDGLMLGWTLGGYPSPNLEVVAEISRTPDEGQAPANVDEALAAVAQRRFGSEVAPAVVRAWKRFSVAFSEFPYGGSTVYNAPSQMGPANLLWAAPTNYRATVVGIPYDDLSAWRGEYPTEVFIGQMTKIADGFDAAIEELKTVVEGKVDEALQLELNVDEAAAIHFRSVANQCRFVDTRDRLANAPLDERGRLIDSLEGLLRSEQELARRLYAIQRRDSRIGFEASNHYFYVPMDLIEKDINCEHLLNHWVTAIRTTHQS